MPIFLICLFFSNSFAKDQAFEIVSYNVQNLFDADHDVENEDYEFLPLKHPLKEKGCKKQSKSRRNSCRKRNWNNKSVILKINQIKKAIDHPDVLAIIEIENKKVANQLANELGFSNFVVSKIHDQRGLRTAFFYRQGKIIRKREIPIQKSRSIFEIRLDFNGEKKLTFFVNHWPSQMNASYQREAAGRKLLKRINQLRGEKIIILGDFNFDPRYEGNSLFEDEKLIDLGPIYEKNPGTYFYIPEKKWWGFDRVLVTKNLLKSIKDFKILRKSEISRNFILDGLVETIPFRFNYETSDSLFAGFSDHFPVQLRLLGIN